MPGLTPNFGEFTAIGNPTGSNFLVGYDVSGSSYIRVPVSGIQGCFDRFTPLQYQPPAVNYATLNTRNSIAVLDFNDTTSQSGMFVGWFPFGASLSNGVNVDIKWIAATGAGNVIWGAQFMPLNAASNLNMNNFALAATGIATALTTGLTTTTTLRVTGLSGMVGGDSYRLNVYRIMGGHNTLQGDAEAHSIITRGA